MASLQIPYNSIRGANDVEFTSQPPVDDIHYWAAALEGGSRTVMPIVELAKHPIKSAIALIRLPFVINLRQTSDELVQYVKCAMFEDESITQQEKAIRRFHLVSEIATLILPALAGKTAAKMSTASSAS